MHAMVMAPVISSANTKRKRRNNESVFIDAMAGFDGMKTERSR